MLEIEQKTDLFILSGSRMYGCKSDDSDFDYRGFYIEPAEKLLGMRKFHTINSTGRNDISIWGWMQFHKLLIKGNPNIIELLFAPTNCIRNITYRGRKLIENKELYITDNCIKSMCGFSQNQWKNVIFKEKQSHNKMTYSKMAYHAIRILEQGIELASTGNVTFPRPNADQLNDIKHGNINIKDLKNIYEKLDAKIIKYKNKLKDPNKEELEQFYYFMIEEELKKFINKRYKD